MKRALICLFVLAVLVAASPSTLAAKPDYTYVEVGYNDVDIDNLGSGNEKGDGYFAGGSVGFAGNWHILGRYNSTDTDMNFELTHWMIGGGFHGLLGEKADVVGELFWVDLETKNAAGATTRGDDGYGARVGLRWRVLKFLEVGAFGKWQDMSKSGSDGGYEANAIFHFWRIGVGLGYEDISDVATFNAFARFNFSKR